MKNVILADTHGFCFGVDNSVNLAEKVVSENSEVYALGSVIHNKIVMDKLTREGMKVVDSLDEVPNGSIVVIRAHGVAKNIYIEAKKKDIEVVDATCPYVKKIHDIVSEKDKEGYKIVIIGNSKHPEVEGVNGWCSNKAYIVHSVDELDIEYLKDFDKVFVVAQTTITQELWNSVLDELNRHIDNLEFSKTICNATEKRQTDARKLANQVDLMIVIGDSKSSNTQKLYEICKACVETIMVESAEEISCQYIQKYKMIGITAGASTPESVIKEVIGQMDEIKNQETEISFAEAFEESMVSLRRGQTVKGVIIGSNDTDVFVNLGYKSDGIISVSEFLDSDQIQVGNEIEAYIMSVNDAEGMVTLSKSVVDSNKFMDDAEKLYESKEVIDVKVASVVKSGVLANYKNIKLFIPASQLSDKKVEDLEEFVGKTLKVRIIKVNKEKKSIVASAKTLLNEEKRAKRKELFEKIEVGQKHNGTVVGMIDSGAFVDLDGVTGFLHVSEISWNRIKKPADVLTLNDAVEVEIIKVDKESERISLRFKKMDENPWTIFTEKFKVGDVINGEIVRIIPFGAFVNVCEGIDGLVNIAQISNFRLSQPEEVLSVGMMVDAKIMDINNDKKKVALSIKEVAPIDNPERIVEQEARATERAERIAEREQKKKEAAIRKAEKAERDAEPKGHFEELTNTIAGLSDLKIDKD